MTRKASPRWLQTPPPAPGQGPWFAGGQFNRRAFPWSQAGKEMADMKYTQGGLLRHSDYYHYHYHYYYYYYYYYHYHYYYYY